MTLARLPFMRLVRSRLVWAFTVGASAIVFAVAWLLQHREVPPSAHAIARALDLYASIAVPLLVFAVVSAGLDGNGLARSGRALVRLGAPRGRVASTTAFVTMLASAVVAGIMGAVVIACAHGAGDPRLATDVMQTMGFGALAAAAYAAYFLMGSALIGSFWGRGIFLMLDFIVGSDDGLGAAFTPRGHFRNVLGGEAPFDMAPSDSLMALAAIVVVCAGFAVWRTTQTRV